MTQSNKKKLKNALLTVIVSLVASVIAYGGYYSFKQMHMMQSEGQFCGVVEGKFTQMRGKHTQEPYPKMAIKYDHGHYRELDVTMGTWHKYDKGDRICFHQRWMDAHPVSGWKAVWFFLAVVYGSICIVGSVAFVLMMSYRLIKYLAEDDL